MGPVETQLKFIDSFSMQLLTVSDVWARYKYIFPSRLDFGYQVYGQFDKLY